VKPEESMEDKKLRTRINGKFNEMSSADENK
jgi:hypothetical protein